jgi:hypothetical protein
MANFIIVKFEFMQTRQEAIDLRISFMLRRTTLNEEGKSPIVVRVSYRDEIRDTFTGLYVEDRFWIKRVGKVEPNNPKASVINGKLSKLAHRVYEHFEELKYSRKDFSIDKLADKIRGKNSPPETLMEYVEEKIKEYKARITIDLAKPTWYKYERVKKYLIEFLKLPSRSIYRKPPNPSAILYCRTPATRWSSRALPCFSWLPICISMEFNEK